MGSATVNQVNNKNRILRKHPKNNKGVLCVIRLGINSERWHPLYPATCPRKVRVQQSRAMKKKKNPCSEARSRATAYGDDERR